jgi:hypothetical protein
MKKTTKSRPVVVTTAHRGIFVGRTTDSGDAETITLTDARMVVYYSRETRSVLGIASRGVAPGSRVSPPVPRLKLRAVTAVIDATPEAERAWRTEPWS